MLKERAILWSIDLRVIVKTGPPFLLKCLWPPILLLGSKNNLACTHYTCSTLGIPISGNGNSNPHCWQPKVPLGLKQLSHFLSHPTHNQSISLLALPQKHIQNQTTYHLNCWEGPLSKSPSHLIQLTNCPSLSTCFQALGLGPLQGIN